MTDNMTYGTTLSALTYFGSYNIRAKVEMEELQEDEFLMYLLKATQLVDSFKYKGVPELKDQPLKFPRVFESGEDPQTPDPIKYATYETAYSLYKAEATETLSNIQAQTKAVKSQSLDTLRVEYFESNNEEKRAFDFIPIIAKQYLNKYINKSRKPNQLNNYQVQVIKV